MWIMLVMGSSWIYPRPNGPTRGKWRILDGNDESGLDLKFGAPRW
jgi:hypothetical protein